MDRNYKTLAISIGADAVYAVPESIEDAAETARQLAPYLSLPEKELAANLTSDKRSVWLKRGLSPEVSKAIRDLGLPGIRLIKRPQRYYPHGSLAAHILGIAGIDNQGLEGIEYFYEEILSGTDGRLALEKDAAQRSIPGGAVEFIPPQNGFDVVLTIDAVLQYIAENKIKEAVLQSGSERGLVLMLAPKTGEILANAIFPTFDPNDYQKVSHDQRRNVAITDQYEPGSTFKFITAAAALDLGLTTTERRFDGGSTWQVGGGQIRSDGRTGEAVTFLEAFERSDNITFAQLSVEMGPERFAPYIQSFGFGSRLGVDFPGEISGVVSSAEKRQGQTLQWANIGFGQGIAVTPLQLASAMGAIANNGVVMRPFFLKEIRDGQGKLIQEFTPQSRGAAVKSGTAAQVSTLLRSAVVNGSGTRADIPGYYVAGKTGTAEVPEEGGYSDKRIASFVGFGPVDDPVLVTLVILFNPAAESSYGGVLAAPVFKEVMADSLEYLGIKRRQPGAQASTLVMVPNVINFSKADALNKLAAANLQGAAAGQGDIVADQSPKPGQRVSPYSTVHLYFYGGEKKAEVTVPSVIGLSMRDASLKLSEAGLQIRILGSGLAVKQSPAAGGKISAGATVEVNFEL